MRIPMAIVAVAALGLALLLVAPAPGNAAAEWEVVRSLNTGTRPLDVAVSMDGRSVFVLTEDGVLSVYTPDGALTETFQLAKDAERIAIAPDGERVYVTSRQGKRVDVVQLDFVREIALAGSPAKGPERAPVTIAVFSDFQ
jgi:DNA-binding beta-propeller fold protein YncE